jgi:NAD(P)-dependent dehydrogenase (short-subunit alcohol dehydrogenase family)
MTLDLTGKKVVLTGWKHSVGRAIAKAVAREGADVVICLRKCNDEMERRQSIANNATGNSIATTQWESANLALAPNNGAEILLVIRLGNARTSRLTLKDFRKIFGIKMHRIGMERR